MKSSFYKIFLGYFISVFMFIIILGFLYFNQQKDNILQQTSMDMYRYFLKLQQKDFKYHEDGYGYEMTVCVDVDNQLPIKIGRHYIKVFSNYYTISIKSDIVDRKIKEKLYFTLLVQLVLIILFLILSFVLAKLSLKPLEDNISHLDRFLADLIHDLNTPVASIFLNTKMLEKKDVDQKLAVEIELINSSTKYISSLYNNLKILLEKEIKKEMIDISKIIDDTKNRYKVLYPNILFKVDCDDIKVNTNKLAIERILDNIVSNSCKYSTNQNPFVYIKCKNNILSVEDNGKGMKYPKKIFERNYQEHNNSGYGIGAHIILRLCNKLGHKIDVNSTLGEGSLIIIKF
jgi:two-component system OmpR family sensor kinase